jgi:hypothetical protein
MKVNEPSEPWPGPACDWEGSEAFLLQHGAARSFRDNLIWLEEMTEFAERLSKAPSLKESPTKASPK